MGRGISFNALTSVSLRHLAQNQSDVEAHLRRLSTGLRIERAADDPAGLAISERMRARLASQDVASRNLQDGVSLLRTAESSLVEVASMLSRMRELTIAALNGTQSDLDVQSLQVEFEALAQEIQRGVKATRFNGIELLTADQVLTIHAGADRDDRIDLALVDLSAMGKVLQVLDLRTNANSALATVDGYIDLVSAIRGDFGAQEQRLGSALRSLSSARVSLTATESRIRDLDFARETAALTGAEIRRDASLLLLSRAQYQPLQILTLLEGAASLSGAPNSGDSGKDDEEE